MGLCNQRGYVFSKKIHLDAKIRMQNSTVSTIFLTPMWGSLSFDGQPSPDKNLSSNV